jgi:hypothetical protein
MEKDPKKYRKYEFSKLASLSKESYYKLYYEKNKEKLKERGRDFYYKKKNKKPDDEISSIDFRDINLEEVELNTDEIDVLLSDLVHALTKDQIDYLVQLKINQMKKSK